MSQDKNAQDPLEFVRGMWNNMGFSLPGMVTPTLDVEELDKRQHAAGEEGAPEAAANPFAAAATMWPWNLMNAEQDQTGAAPKADASTDTTSKSRSTRRKSGDDK